MSIPEIKKTTIQERLTTMEQIWDSLCHEDTEPSSPSWHETILTEPQKYGCCLASAHAVGEARTLRAIEAEARAKLSPEAVNAAKAAITIMGMNNVCYRATLLVSKTT